MRAWCGWWVVALAGGVLAAAEARAADATVKHEHTGIVTAYTADPPPVKLTAADLSSLAEGKVVTKQVQVASGGRGIAVMDVKAPVEKIWSKITAYSKYPQWVNHVEECGNYRTEGNLIYTRFLLEVMGVDVEYFIRHDYRPDKGYLSWTLDYSRSSDLDDSVGYWRLTPMTTDPPRTRLEYSVDIRFKGWIPGFVAKMIQEKGLSDATTWVRKQSEG